MLVKAVRYYEEMTSANAGDWNHALWSTLALELTARAALASVSPALLADTSEKNWSSLYHSLGFEPTETKFVPRSIPIREVLRRLNTIYPDFTSNLEAFCALHIGRRNAELHSGENPFEGVDSASWQPKFYKSCKILLETMGQELSSFVGADEAKAADALIAAAEDEAAKSILGELDAYEKVWLGKTDEERQSLSDTAKVWAAREWGHRVDCPSCGSQALVAGDAVAPPQSKLELDIIVEQQEFLPNRFSCIACGLKASGLNKLHALGLANRFKKTTRYDAADYYAPIDEMEFYEEDNNEPY